MPFRGPLVLTETAPGEYQTWWTVPPDVDLTIRVARAVATIAGEVKAVSPAVAFMPLPPPPPPAPPQAPPPPPPAPGPPPPPAPGPAPAPAPAPSAGGPPSVTLEPPILPPAAPAPWGGFGAPGAPTRSIPDGQLWVTPDDLFVVGVRSSQSGVVLTLALRYFTPDGQFAGGSLTIKPSSDRTLKYYALPLSYGYVTHAALAVTSGSVARGQVFAQLLLARGVVAAFTTYAVLAQDYLSPTEIVSFPRGPVVDATTRPGYTSWQYLSVPTGTGDASIIVPVGARWRIRGVNTAIVTGGTAGNRSPYLSYGDPTRSFPINVPFGITAPANTTLEFDWVEGVGTPTSDGARAVSFLAAGIELLGQATLHVSWSNFKAGDAVNQPYLQVEEVLDIGSSLG